MDCILIRHGIAVERDEWPGPEPERPLTVRGTEKTRLAAKGLLRVGVEPSHVLSSPYARAYETATILKDMFQAAEEIRRFEALLPDAPPERLLDLLAELPMEACALCVGHEPHLGATAGVMIFGGAVPTLVMKKAGACCIRFDGAVKPGEGTLRWWLTPSQLRLLGKG